MLRSVLMSRDTKAIIGTVIGTGLVLAVLLSAQIAAVNSRIDDLISRIDDLSGRISGLETDVRSMNARLRALEIAFGKLDQRLLTIERAVLPAPAPGQ